MIDPVSLGIAAAALLASKFGEQLAQTTAASSLHAVTRLRELIAKKFSSDEGETPTALAALDQDPTPQNQVAAAEVITSAARSDPGFAADLQHLVATARQDRTVEAFIANAYDTAKQVNIRGDNTGTININ
ncbi:hypothetical protein [Nocardia sp. NPDC049526]|uniref:hypothetical protein n=1 Tax=Nocardia sp. NPDC049526 TaxID=3364316 RepID=UPI0037B516CD